MGLFNALQRVGQAAPGSLALLNGDYGLFAQMQGQQARQRAAAAEAQAAQAQRQSMYNNLVKQGMDPGTAELVMSNPEAFGQEFNTRFRTREQGAAGGSVSTPGLDGSVSHQFAPSQTVDNGRIIRTDPSGQSREIYDARQNDVEWVNGPWGAFSTDRSGRPTAPGVNIQSPMGQPPQGAAPQPMPGPSAAAPTATPTGYAMGVASELARAGLPPQVVAGIIGNGEHESGGRWNQAVGDNGTAHGAFQWRNERVTNFQQVTGVHPSQATPQQTAQFVLWEMQNPERAGMSREGVAAILNARTPEDAARLFSQHYERPNAALAHDDRRAALASQFAGGGQQFAQAAPQNMPGQGRSVQEQAAGGFVTAPTPAPAGYQWGPNGTLVPIAGGPGAQAAAQEGRQQRGEIESLVQNFESQPQVRLFYETRTAMQQVERLANIVPQGHPERAQHDMALVFAVMRAYDPSASVREGEYATAQNSASVPDRVRNLYNSMVNGSFLSPGQRRGMVSSAYQLYLGRAQSYNDYARRLHPRLRNLGVPEPGEFVPLATGPETERRQREPRRIGGGTATLGGRRSGRTSSGVQWRVRN